MLGKARLGLGELGSGLSEVPWVSKEERSFGPGRRGALLQRALKRELKPRCGRGSSAQMQINSLERLFKMG